MENSLEAASILRRELGNRIGNTDGIFFLGSVIDRIVPVAANGLDIECEKYCSITIENSPGFGDLAKEESLLTDHIKREFDKKFLLVNGLHASAAYLGYLRGHEHIRDVMADAVVRRKLERIGGCYIQYLIGVYGYREDELIPYFNNTLRRFSNPFIKDSLSRVGRNLLIKLAPTDRIIRPLLFNKSNGLHYAPLEEVVEAARHFTIANDYEQYLPYLNELKPEAVASGENVLPSVDQAALAADD
jgi:mannitol-1-phosphate 5-dehydrogenase